VVKNENCVVCVQVNSGESEKTSLQAEVAAMTSRLVEARTLICELEEENVSGYLGRHIDSFNIYYSAKIWP